MNHKEIIEANARKFAASIQWNTDDAVTFITELLTDVNMHTVCQKFQELLAEEENRLNAIPNPFESEGETQQ